MSVANGQQLEQHLERFARWICERASAVLVLSLALTAVAAFGLSFLRFEISTASFLTRSDQARLDYDRFREQFGSDDFAILTLHSENLFTRKFLNRLRELHEAIERDVPYVHKVTSLINARSTYGTDDELIVDDLIPGGHLSRKNLDGVKRTAENNPVYRNALLSEDGHYTTVSVELQSPTDNSSNRSQDLTSSTGSRDLIEAKLLTTSETDEVALALKDVARQYAADDFPIWLTGRAPISHAILGALRKDMMRCSVASCVVMAILLFIVFRRLDAVLLSLLSVGAALLGTFGVMGYLGVPITPTAQIVPSFVMAVGIGDAVHLLTLVFRKLDDGASTEDAVVHAIGHSGLALIMTSVTTAVCLMTFLFADLEPVSALGASAAIGVIVALAYTLTLLPAIIVTALLGRRDQPARAAWSIDEALSRTAIASSSRPYTVLAIWGVVLVFALIGVGQTRIEHEPVSWFRENHPARQGVEVVNKHLNSGTTFEIVLDTGEKGGLYKPSALHKVDMIREYLESIRIGSVNPGRAVSVVDIVKETHRALNENREEYFAIPNRREAVAQELLLFEMSGSEDIHRLVDPEYRRARIMVLVPIVDSLDQSTFLDVIERKLELIASDEFDVGITGQARLLARTQGAMLMTMLRSYFMALVMLVPLMMLVSGSVRAGLFVMVPNIAPILISIGWMHFFDLPLDMFTMLVGSIAIGVAVDDTIHFVHNFRRYFRQYDDVRRAVSETMLTSGKAMLFTSLVLMAGFLVFARAEMAIVVNFGVITAYTVMVAFMADATLSPAVAVLLARTNGWR